MINIGMRKNGIIVNILNFTNSMTKDIASCSNVTARKNVRLLKSGWLIPKAIVSINY